MGFRFQDPLWLLMLLPLAALAWLIARRRRSAVTYSSVDILRSLPRTAAQRVRRMLPWLSAAGMALLIVALARPQHGREEYRIRAEGIAIEMCIDRSGSMEAMDFELDGKRVNRLAVVKDVFHKFVAGDDKLPGRTDDMIGLVDFGGFAEAKCPLTLDHEALLELLKTVKIPQPIKDSQGRVINMRLLQLENMTAIGDALTLSVERLEKVKAKSKIIILLSDGENNAGAVDPAAAAQLAKSLGIKVYAIGIGATGRAPFLVTDPIGREVVQWANVELDERTLRMIADVTGGKYYSAQNTDALKDVYTDIDNLEKTASRGRIYSEYRELFEYALVPGLVLILSHVVLVSTRFRSLP
ncbi:MAG: VWA domain-containing protein [Pirellulales bacterium]|nr:VWA domain-containing protein [Pirellulales bacterium]